MNKQITTNHALNKNILRASLASCLIALSQGAWAASFVVRDIQINGIERVDPGTVLSNIPVRVGGRFEDHMTGNIVRSLYKTGLFDDVSLSQKGDILVVNVHERTAVGEINITGNKAFKSEQLMQVLQRNGIRKGQTLNRSALARVEQQIKQHYQAKGKYGVSVKASSHNLARNRVAVNIDINEGEEARIKKVHILGNKAYPEKTLLKLMETGTRSKLAFFGSRDKYSKAKLVGDLDKLTSFYRDRGYLNFEITSTQVTMSPDKRDIFVNINVHEGDQYRVGEIDVTGAGLSPQKARSVMKMKRGQVFSQRLLEESRKELRKEVGKGGHAFAKINIVPRVDEARKIVNLSFQASEGKRVYVRRINIRGNYRTKDEVFRREMRQLESSWYSREKIERSKVRIQRLPYVQSVKIQTVPVAGTKDQVDLEVTVAEQLSNQFTAGVGYSQTQGVLFNLGLKQENFLGSGKKLGINLNNSKSVKNYSLNFNDPYHTVDGVGRGFNLHYNKTDTEEDDLVSSYLSNSYGGDLNYTIPLTETDSFRFSIGAEQREILTTADTPKYISNPTPAPGESLGFLQKHGSDYTQFLGTVSYVHDTRDRTIFPTDGSRQSIAFEAGLPGSDLQFYKLRYRGANYWAINEDFTFAIKGGISYGDGFGDLDELPFFEKFYAGGIGTVRGFEKSSLGARDENNDSRGGDFAINGTAELSFPAPFAKEVKGLRLNAFVDAGNVFDDFDAFETSEVRYSAGVGATWLSPLGPLTISYAKPLNAKEGDEEQTIQFSIGATF
jgi:outer membrane protein insertion porin family